MPATAPSAHKHTNRLIDETSPYLLQHAHNPVDWYAWGPEAFEAARKQNKPIFLSVGYSTCYWCHVMERESFENEAIAAEMNARFICIKVDREERPDVDQLYMTSVQVLTRQGGWPMSVFLMPDLRPFYGGTYFPPEDRYGRPGFPTLLRAIDDAYKNRRADVEKTATQLENILRQLAQPPAPQEPIDVNDDWLAELLMRSVADYDPTYGGFGAAPKFPRETLLELLLVHNRQSPDERRMQMIRHTLDAMAAGGIRDHLGGGFHRYSTDAQWLVPHFEIMLYDNAMLAWIYVEAYRQTEDRKYARIARGIFDFVLREMTSKKGAFYTAFDAEVDAREGASYLWTAQEIEAVLGTDDAKLFNRVYGVDEGPNFADPHHGGGKPEKNILYLPNPNEQTASEDQKLGRMRQKLYEARAKRKQPLLDTKILASWNALMIRALAFGGKALEEPKYVEAAARAANFLLEQHRTSDGGLVRTSRDGKKKIDAFLDDYAFVAQALLALRDASGDKKWKTHAEKVARAMTDRFGDAERGGFFFTQREGSDVIVRQKTSSDSPLPSGNAVAAMVMLDLDQPHAARDTLATFAGQMQHGAEGMSSMVQAALKYLQTEPAFTVTPDAAGDPDRPLSPQQLAQRVVSLRSQWQSPTELRIHVNILKGFHINAHEASEGLIATELKLDDESAQAIKSIDYPPAQRQRFSFADKPIAVYSGDVTVVVHFKAAPSKPLTASLHYQPCDDSACLPAVAQHTEIPPP